MGRADTDNGRLHLEQEERHPRQGRRHVPLPEVRRGVPRAARPAEQAGEEGEEV